MHSAPSVSYPVGRSRFLAGALAALWLAGAATIVFGWQGVPPGRLQATFAFAVWGLAGFMACRFWMTLPQGDLRWDGHTWEIPGASTSSAGVRVLLDAQCHLLLRAHGGEPAGRWLWLSATSRPARWNDLRRAVYSPAMTDAKQDGTNP